MDRQRHAYKHVCMHAHTHVHTHTHACMHLHIHTHTHTHTSVFSVFCLYRLLFPFKITYLNLNLIRLKFSVTLATFP